MSLQNEIDKLKTLQESFNELSSKVLDTQAVLTELNNGKKEMVDALATKNVKSSTDKTLSSIASDIRSIAQSPITIDGGEMYEKQLFGAPTDKTNVYKQPDSPTWNLYQVMANLLNDGRFLTYGGIVLCEYSKSKPDIQLIGAGAGGAYLTSDGDVYYEDVSHTWHDYDDRKENRWVAYFLANEFIDFTIPSPSPYRIHIGRKVGHIKSSTGTTIKDIVCTDGNEFSLDIAQTTACGDTLVLNNLSKFDKPLPVQFLNGCTKAIIDIKGELTNYIIRQAAAGTIALSVGSIIFKNIGKENIITGNKAIFELTYGASAYFYPSYISFPKGYRLHTILCHQFPANTSKVLTIDGIEKLAKYIIYNMSGTTNTTLEEIHMPDLEVIESGGSIIRTFRGDSSQGGKYDALTKICVPKLKQAGVIFSITSGGSNNLIDVEVGAMETSFSVEYWRPSSVLADEDKTAQLNKNIRDHIAAKVTDRNGQEPLTITFHQLLRDALTEENEQAFRDKNWNIAPAKTVTE